MDTVLDTINDTEAHRRALDARDTAPITVLAALANREIITPGETHRDLKTTTVQTTTTITPRVTGITAITITVVTTPRITEAIAVTITAVAIPRVTEITVVTTTAVVIQLDTALTTVIETVA